jgi:hypothetical protein
MLRFKHPFMRMARRRGKDQPARIRWYYRKFARAWLDCCNCDAVCERTAAAKRQWFKRINRLMTRAYGPIWFCSHKFEDGEYLLHERSDRRRERADSDDYR